MQNVDFGASRPGPLPWGRFILAGAVCVGLAGHTLMLRIERDRAAAIAEARAWTIDGAPCPQLSPAEAKTWPYQGYRTFDYAGVTFGRAIGHVACAQIHDDGGAAMFRGHPVCQFTSPAVVSVKAGKTSAFFTPGLGQRATVSVQDGVARCVMAGNFYGQNDF